jgi:prepilin-type N-terminal cleavage/methylation domain-containing protein
MSLPQLAFPCLTKSKVTFREDGFTLIEIIVVMVIIGILAGFGIPVLVNRNSTVKDADLKIDFGATYAKVSELHSSASKDKVITAADLPENVQHMLENHKASIKVVRTKEDGFCLTLWSVKSKTYNLPSKGLIGGTNVTTCGDFGITGTFAKS